jgi:TonB-dependent Receptor Plug Domain
MNTFERNAAAWLRVSVSILALAAADLALADDAPPKKNDNTSIVSELVVNGVPYKETVLPTRLSTNSVYGLDLGVLDTPRNTTLISTTQLETVNIQDPRAFSYLTASSYSDSSFGTPNIPRIRGQYADVFINGMRYSFTQNGYGVPLNFDALENVSIVKGPASVVDGPGPGVGGEADLITKRPSLSEQKIVADATFDTVSNRRWGLDVSMPLIKHELGLRISYSGEYSDSYFTNHYMHKNAVYAALRWEPNDRYRLDLNGEVNFQTYTENVGVNRVNQNLIDNNLYLQGVPTGEAYSSFFGYDPLPIGSPGNPFSPLAPILTEVTLTSAVPLNTRTTIDATPGVITKARTYNFQAIQTYRLNPNLTLEDNAFFTYQDSENREPYYFADASFGSWTFENRADLKGHFTLDFAGLHTNNDFIIGAAFRYAHVNYINNFSAETPAAFDLTTNPALWVWDNPTQVAYADAFPYTGPFGGLQYGVPGRDVTDAGNDGISDLYDYAVFFQHRLSFSRQLSFLYGGRLDLVYNHSFDPLGGAVCDTCYTGTYYDPNTPQPQQHDTGTYGLGNVNASLVYRPQPWVTFYGTFDFTQSVNPNGGIGGVNTFLQAPDHEFLRSDSYLYEGGVKLNLMNNKLFIGTAGFDQKRNIPVGPSGTKQSRADIAGFEIEANYQPNRRLYATASYSYIKTTLHIGDPSNLFYNYPAEPGLNVDGAGIFAVFKDGQSYNDPGVPRQLFNFLGNYKFKNGFGFRFGVQVIGPIQTSFSGYLDPVASSFVPMSVQSNNWYFRSPTIPTQYTMNIAAFYEWKQYSITASLYNVTNQINWESAPAYYGNDFLVRSDPRTFEVRLTAKF